MARIKVSVFATDRRWLRGGDRESNPSTVLFGSRFAFHVEPGFPGSDVTAPDPDEGILECTAGEHAGQRVYLSTSDEVVIEVDPDA